jgi:hypothetical protein
LQSETSAAETYLGDLEQLVHDKASMNTAAGISIELAQERMKDLETAAAALVEGLIGEGIPGRRKVQIPALSTS